MTADIQQISLSDDAYPPLLKEIHDPPRHLYVRGNLHALAHQPSLAVVGSRKATIYGQQAIHKLLTPAVQQGLALISGLALGIDGLAHKLCLEHQQPTVAVLGSGCDDKALYPKAHFALARKIILAGGALVSEYAPGTPGHPMRFPARNRIIAGMASATLVVQAARRSGSLITARLALESGRDVAAVPGRITDDLAAGTNALIQQGATPITSSDDIFAWLNIQPRASQAQLKLDLSPVQKKVLNYLASEAYHIDQIAENTNIPASSLSTVLTELELLDAIEHVGSMKYIKKN